MLIDLSQVVSQRHTPVEARVPLETEMVRIGGRAHPVADKAEARVQVEHRKGKEIQVRMQARLSIWIPCDRCLTPVEVPFQLDIERRVDLDKADGELTEELDESGFLEGMFLDTERLLYDGLLTEWPMKVLCKEDCKGICRICGQDLNRGECRCKPQDPDPRMSVIREIFEKSKEV